MANAVFTRYPGGNARVVEMLAAAGADPNPCVDKDRQKRLLDKISQACKEEDCSVPDEPVIVLLEKLNGTTVERGK